MSSSDKWAKLFITSDKVDFIVDKGEIISSENFPLLNGEHINDVEGDEKFTIIYLKSDKKFSDMSRGLRFGEGFAGTPEFKLHVQSYVEKGWITERIENSDKDAYDQREKKRTEERKKAEGIVLWMDYEKYKADTKLYQGGFSDGVFNSEGIQNYIKRGGAFGWIGHSCARRAEHDKIIEKGLRERGISDKSMYYWITSGDGRHFADSLEGYTLEEQIEKINKRLNSIFNYCLIYGCKRHTGMLRSSMEIREDYEKQGILLPEDDSDYDRIAHFNLMALFFGKIEVS